jgi:hypothetical protein
MQINLRNRMTYTCKYCIMCQKQIRKTDEYPLRGEYENETWDGYTGYTHVDDMYDRCNDLDRIHSFTKKFVVCLDCCTGPNFYKRILKTLSQWSDSIFKGKL